MLKVLKRGKRKMQYQWFVFWSGLFDWLIFSVSLFVIADKLGWQKKRDAWVPGLRIYRLGESVHMNKEGMFCGVMDLLFTAAILMKLVIKGGRISVLASLIHLVLFIFLFIYRIRIFLQILKLFGLSKKWLILWLVANWLPLLIIGLGKKYQPKKERIKEELWEAGEKAAGIPGAASAPVILSDEGLSAHLRERTVKDFGKKRCLLKDISLNIPPNSLVLLLGGSGAGKTTLINALIGYEQADATVLLNGVNVYKEYDRVKHKIGFVPLQNLIRGKDTVIRTVSDAAEMRLPTSISTEQRKQLIKEDMDLLGLSAGLPEPCPHVQCPRPHVVGDQVVELVRAVLFLCSSSDVKSPLQ